MNTYIIRIYRRDSRDPLQMVGRVEDAESGEERTFHDAGELVALLQGGDAGSEPQTVPATRKVAESG